MSGTAIVYGPMACGKTRNAEAMRKALGCAGVADDCWPGVRLRAGFLHLTNEQPSREQALKARVLSFDEAMRIVNGSAA